MTLEPSLSPEPSLGDQEHAMAFVQHESTAHPAYSPATENVEVSVVLPCLNEAETLETCIRKAQASLARLGVPGEVIVADNGSTDGSQQIANRLGARVVDVPVRGYGAALQAGIELARGEYVIMADADDSYELERLDPFIEKLRNGYDLVMGNRFAGGIAPGAMPPLHKYLGNPVLSTLGRVFFPSSVRDFHCGMRGFRRDVALRMSLRTTGMEFASEMVVKATIMQMRITEVPTRLVPDGRSRAPHLRSWRDGWRHLRFLLLYSPRFLFLFPGFLLAAAGLLGAIALVPGPRALGGVVFDIDSLLFCGAAVILGSQAVLFWTFSKVFAVSEELLPPDPRLSRLFRVFTLEVGVVVGALLFLVGLACAMAAVRIWSSSGHGQLDPRATLRIVIPSVVLMILGAQGVMGSFFLSVLGLKRR